MKKSKIIKMLPADLANLYEAYKNVYEQDSDAITDELIEEIVEELVNECIDFGYELEESLLAVEDATNEYLIELNPYAPAGSKDARAYQKSTTSTKRGEERRTAVKGAVERVKAKAKGVAAGVGIAGSIAKDEVRRAGRAASHAVRSGVEKKKQEIKKGVKSLIGRGLRAVSGGAGKVAQVARRAGSAAGKAAEKLGEEKMKGKDPCWKTHEMVGTKMKNGKEVPNCVPKEEIEIFDTVLKYLIDEGYASTETAATAIMTNMSEDWRNAILEGAYEDRIAANNKKYDKNRQRAAQRAQARNAARDSGKTGAVPGVGYVTPRKERTTYTDAAGTERHHSGARMPKG